MRAHGYKLSCDRASKSEPLLALWRAILVIGLWLAIGCANFCLGQEGPPIGPRLFAPAEYGQEDAALLDELKGKLAVLPADQRTAGGIQLLQANVDKVQSPSLRARFLVELAALYVENGQPDTARDTLAGAFRDYSNTDMGLFAADRLISLVSEDFEYETAAQVARRVLDIPTLRKEQIIHFTGRLGFLLVAGGHVEEGVSVVSRLIETYKDSEDMVGEACEEVAVTAGTVGREDIYYEGMKRISEGLPTYANTARFLGNFGHACQENGKKQEAIQLYLRVIENWPDDERVPSFILEAANLYAEVGDLLAAYALYGKLLEMQSDDEYVGTLKKLAKANRTGVERQLGISERDTERMMSLESPPDAPSEESSAGGVPPPAETDAAAVQTSQGPVAPAADRSTTADRLLRLVPYVGAFGIAVFVLAYVIIARRRRRRSASS